MGSLWGSYGDTMGQLWGPYGLNGAPWDSMGSVVPMGSMGSVGLCGPYGLCGVNGFYDLYGVSMGQLWGLYGALWGL